LKLANHTVVAAERIRLATLRADVLAVGVGAALAAIHLEVDVCTYIWRAAWAMRRATSFGTRPTVHRSRAESVKDYVDKRGSTPKVASMAWSRLPCF